MESFRVVQNVEARTGPPTSGSVGLAWARGGGGKRSRVPGYDQRPGIPSAGYAETDSLGYEGRWGGWTVIPCSHCHCFL